MEFVRKACTTISANATKWGIAVQHLYHYLEKTKVCDTILGSNYILIAFQVGQSPPPNPYVCRDPGGFEIKFRNVYLMCSLEITRTAFCVWSECERLSPDMQRSEEHRSRPKSHSVTPKKAMEFVSRLRGWVSPCSKGQADCTVCKFSKHCDRGYVNDMNTMQMGWKGRS